MCYYTRSSAQYVYTKQCTIQVRAALNVRARVKLLTKVAAQPRKIQYYTYSAIQCNVIQCNAMQF